MKTTNEGSTALTSAIILVNILSWIGMIVGVIITLMTIIEDPTAGLTLIGIALSGFILKNTLKGIRTIALASEKYLENTSSTEEPCKNLANEN